LADRYRAAGAKIVLGGLHVSALPEESSEHADSVVVGEGEPLWPRLLEDFRRNKLQRVYDARGEDYKLADAPMPRFELLDPRRYNRVTVQTQRGCPFRCDFCAASVMVSPVYKVKPVEKVVAEIRRIKEVWGHTPFIEFADDNTFVNKKHSKELMRAIASEKIRWFTETDVSVADDEELLRLMRESGCAQVLIGFENVSHSGLDGVELQSNWKLNQLERYKRAVEQIQDHGITVNGCFILGLDGTGAENFDEVLRFTRESGLYEVQITILTAFPGTPLYERLGSQGRVLRERAWELCTLFDVNFRPERMTVAALEKGFRDLAEKVYCKEATDERRNRFKQQLRRQHSAARFN
jgi:radical SAM superfamily enzyme YgiQ (UPF0313 family)